MSRVKRTRKGLPIVLAALSVLLIFSACHSDRPEPSYDGGALYMANRANCHGTYGEGDGALTPMLEVVVQDLRYLSQRNNGVFPARFVRDIIDGRETRASHGPAGMPMWGNAFTAQEGVDPGAQVRVSAKIESLVEYLSAIQISEPEE